MTTKVTIDVPEHVERVVVTTESYTAEGGWKFDASVEYGPGSHYLHIWDNKRISCIVERPLADDAPPNVVSGG